MSAVDHGVKLTKLMIAMSIFFGSSVFAEESTLEKEDEIEIITVNSTGLIAYDSAGASKSDVPIIETPASVSVITEQRMTDLGSQTVQDALGYVAGLYNGTYGYDSRGDWSTIRGAEPTTYLDGLKLMFGNYNNTRMNPYSLSRIEVIKGPASVLYGQGTTGGIINLASKLPEVETSGQINVEVGNNDRYQLATDVTGSLNSDDSVLYRMIGLIRDSGTQFDYVDDDAVILSPSMTFYMGDSTEMTLLGNYQKLETGSTGQFYPHEGTVVPVSDVTYAGQTFAASQGDLSSTAFISEPEFDRYDTESYSLTAMFKHEFNDVLSLQTNMRYMDSQADYDSMYSLFTPALAIDNVSLPRTAYSSDATATAFTSDTRLYAIFDTGVIEHEVVFGFDYQDVEYKNVYDYGYGGTINPYAPDYSAFNAATDITWWYQDIASKDEAKQTGVYLQDSMKIADRVIVSGALRYDYVEQKNDYVGWVDQEAVTGRLGLMYLFEVGISPYVNYSQSFEPINGSGPDGLSLKPLEGEQYEVGVKYQPRGTEHLITLSAYDIDQKNYVVPSASGATPTQQDQIGKVNIKGVELEAQLAWEQVDVYASYAFTDSEVKEGTDELVGRPLESTPDNQASIWATYRPVQLDGFKIGAGARYVGHTEFLLQTRDTDAMVTNSLNTGLTLAQRTTPVFNEGVPYQTDSYTLFDFMIGYQYNDYSIALNVKNVADKEVITTCMNRGDCFYGQGRTVIATLTYDF
ncbi:TonB-dependent siderophore receptor [Shewanella surugensis]|uniref:TonB-dependent siderophore receptor n=1 Tax=Shewanella surugensis TaxID=212020 RepID=A0ABT0LCW2_9GAMM|nr:TonB-dependent siderophore receptor [Shewanella surugensis]MCL1125409.1 TonB-dependent siderophore receptor [Shewanella surugensis]